MTSSNGSAKAMREERIADAIDEYRSQLEEGIVPNRDAILSKNADIANQLERCLKGIDMLFCFVPSQLTKHELPKFSDPSTDPKLPDFRIIQELGRGGMGIVYEAEQISLRRKVALKVLPFSSLLEKRQRERFRNEAHAAALLTHPNIVPVHTVGSHEGLDFYAMRLVDGCNVAELISMVRGNEASAVSDEIFTGESYVARLRSDFQLRVESGAAGQQYNQRVVGLIIQAINALDYAHANQVVHRDIKPANLLVDNDGVLYVTDFGLAQLESKKSLTKTGDVIGTLRYASPEQSRGTTQFVDHRSDIFSLGLTLFELLTHSLPYEKTDWESNRRLSVSTLRSPLSLEPNIPVDLETIVLKAIHPEPNERYQAAKAFGDDLKRYLDGRPILARPVSRVKKFWMKARRNPGLSAAVAMIAFLSILATAFAIKFIFANSLAEFHESHLELSRYANQMNAAATAIESGFPEQAIEILEQSKNHLSSKQSLGFEWSCLRQMATSEFSNFRSHKMPISSLAISNNDRMIASGSADTTIKIWETSTGKLMQTLHGPKREVRAVEFLSDNETLVSSGDKIRFWNIKDGAMLSEYSAPLVPGRTTPYDTARIALCENASIVATGGGAVHLWRLSFVNELPRLEHLVTIRRPKQSPWINSLAVSSDGKYVAFSNYFSNDLKDRVAITVYDVAKQAIVKSLDRNTGGHEHNIPALAFSVDGRQLASGSWDETVKIWDCDDWVCKSTLVGHTDAVRDVEFIDETSTVISCGYDGRVLKWDSETGEKEAPEIFNPRWDVDSLCVSNDATFIAGTATERFNDVVAGVLTAGGGESGGANSIRIWNSSDLSDLVPKRNIKERAYVEYRHVGSHISNIVFSPDSLRFVAGFECGLVSLDDVGRDSNLMSDSGRLSLVPFYQLPEKINYVDFSPSAEFIEVNSDHQTCRINCLDQQRSKSIEGSFFESANAVDGSYLRTKQGGLKFCSGSSEVSRLIADFATEPLASSFSAQGKFYSRANSNGKIESYLLSNGNASLDFQIAGSKDIRSIRISNDGGLFATGHNDGRVCLYNRKSQKLLHTMHRHVRPVTSISFNRGATRIATGSNDGSVRIWDVESGLSLLHLRNHEGPISQVSFSPDSRRLAVASNVRYSDDVGVLRIWQTYSVAK